MQDGYRLTDVNDEQVHGRSFAEIDRAGYERLRAMRLTTPHGLSELQASMNLIKGLIGSGIMALPFAFHMAGLWTGLVLLLVTVILSIHCMRQLVRAAHYFAVRTNQPALSYEDVAGCCCSIGPPWLSKHSRLVRTSVSVLLSTSQLGICCVYFVFIAESFRQPLESLNIHWSVQQIMVVILPVILLVCSVRELRFLAPLAALANVIFLAGFVVTMHYVMRDLPSIGRLPAFNSFATMPLAFGTIVFSFEGISLILPIENKSLDPSRFIAPCGTLTISCVVVLILYATMGFFGYVKFGSAIRDSITLNLPADHPLYEMVRCAFGLALCFSYPVQFYVPIEMAVHVLHAKLGPKSDYLAQAEYASRYLLVFVTFLLAELIPYLALFISLVGALVGSLLALVLPAIMETLIECHGQPASVGRSLQMAKNLCICAFGLLGAVGGSYVTLRQIVARFAAEF